MPFVVFIALPVLTASVVMLSLVTTHHSRSYRPMVAMRDREAADRRRKGQALKALRRRLGVTQERAAAVYGNNTKASPPYEHGTRHHPAPQLATPRGSIVSSRGEV